MSIFDKNVEKRILALYKKKGKISSSEVRELYANSKIKTKKTTAVKTHTYDFKVDITSLDEKTFKVIISGRHEANNRINSMAFKTKLRYKASIKKAFENYYLLNKKSFNENIKKFIPFSFVDIYPVAFNKISRDDDGNSQTLKIVRDQLITLGFAHDDNRKYLKQHLCEEVLTKDYKIEILIKGKK